MSLVDEIFRRVQFDTSDVQVHNRAYSAVKEIAEIMDSTAVDCAEKTLAFRALHVALMHFGAALSKNPKYDLKIDLEDIPCHSM